MPECAPGVLHSSETSARWPARRVLAACALSALAALASFVATAASFTLAISPAPVGGRVTSSPTGINCGGSPSPGTACSALFVAGSAVTLTATPDRFFSFIEWKSGTSTSTANPLASTMPPQNLTLTARFGRPPGAPVIGTASPGNGRATIAFTPPGSDGNSPIASYTATATPGGATGTGTGSPIVVTGLVNGTGYTINVRATNEVGTGPASAESDKVIPQAPTAFRTLDIGISHTLAVSSTGQVYAWGSNGVGELGNGTRTNTSVPVRSGTLTGIVAVSAGSDHSAALGSDGRVWVWGGGPAVAAFATETCFNQPCVTEPRLVPNLAGVTAIASGRGFVLARLSDGTVKAWGSNFYGTLGIGSNIDQPNPVTVPGLTNVAAVAAGANHAVARKSDGTVMTWGLNRYGELGATLPNTASFLCDPFPCARTPVQVVTSGTTPLAEVAFVAAKGRHTLALKVDGSVWAWGYNYYGQLGDGSVADRATPLPVPGLAGITDIAAGFSHSIALQNGKYWAWGLDLSGQLGLGLTIVENCVARLLPGGLTTDYQLGDTWRCKTSPVPSTARDGAIAIVGGGAHTLTVRPGGAIAGFGLNSFGQLGTPADRRFVGPGCYADPGSCTGSPQGASASSASISRPSTAGGVNLDDIVDGLAFGPQSLGTTSAPETLRVTNIRSNSQLNILGIDVTGDFPFTTNCGTFALLLDGWCDIVVSFRPTDFGDRAGTLTLTTDDPTGPTAVVDLSGTSPGNSLGVQKGGTGSGVVRSTPSGIDCGSACSALFVPDTTVTLAATPAAGSAFAGWGGDCAGTGGCIATLSGPRFVTATFNALPVFTLLVSKAGTGTGTVTSSIPGIACGSTCSAPFATGTTLTLAAQPGAGSVFAGWSGACGGTGTCAVTMDAAKSVTATFNASPAPVASPPRLGNISTRMQVFTGDNVLIGGFIIGGSVPKTIVVRARGPSLAAFGIANFLANPRLDLYSGPTVIASNDDWGTGANIAALQSSGFAPSNALEAALHTTLAPGAYTAVVSGVGTGVGLIEIFEVDRPEAPLVNISTRGYVLTGDDVMIGGFIIQGTAPQTVVVRARGPSLAPFGITDALADPVLQLYSGQAVIASNDDWQSAPNAAQLQSAGFAPAEAKEAAILITLSPGAYTAIVTGKNGTAGVGIIEVFAQ